MNLQIEIRNPKQIQNSNDRNVRLCFFRISDFGFQSICDSARTVSLRRTQETRAACRDVFHLLCQSKLFDGFRRLAAADNGNADADSHCLPQCLVPAMQIASSNLPIGPFHYRRRRLGSLLIRHQSFFGPMSTPIQPSGMSPSTTIGRLRSVDLVNDQMIGRQRTILSLAKGEQFRGPCRVCRPPPRTADRCGPAAFHEGVRHGAPVRTRYRRAPSSALMKPILSDTLAAAENSYSAWSQTAGREDSSRSRISESPWPRRRCRRRAACRPLIAAGTASIDASLRWTGAEGVVDIDVAKVRDQLGEGSVAGLFAGMKTQILQH